jgi:mono/diheme cytochrome c family protein
MAKRFLRPFHLIIVAGLMSVLLWFNPGMAQSSDGNLDEGARIYAENCQVCHGDQGQGRVGATLAKNWPSIRPDLTIRNVIINGVPGSVMPAWSQDNGGPLSEQQIESLVTYILSWESGEPFVYEPQATATSRSLIEPMPDIEGDPNKGAVLYDENCAVCHGIDGQGRVGSTLGKDWPTIRPEVPIRTVISNGVSGSVMPAWSQDNGGPFSDQDVADVTAFILTLPHISSVSGGMPTAVAIAPSGGMSGITGIIVTLALFAIIVALILFAQRQRTET